MGLRNAKPVGFIPRGLVDANDQSNTFNGACKKLQNLILDAQNPGIVTSRPGATVEVDFSVTDVPAPHGAWADPGVISVFIVIGTRVYGMISTTLTAGMDEPFCFESSTGSFVNITGVTAINVPTTQSSSTATVWTPPTMAQISTKIIVTHPGFDGGAGPPKRFFGIIDISTPSAPTWNCANTATNALPAVPTSVVNYNNRAWYAIGNADYYSDVLVPTTITNSSQVLTIGNASQITAQAGLAIGTSTQGVLAALIVFKGAAESTWQITGDAASSTLALNQLSENTGCWGQRTVVNTPEGLKFMGVDGMYVVTLLGQVIKLLNDPRVQKPDLQEPFINANQAQASHACASYNEAVYRICLDTVVGGQPITGADYWFDENSRRWTGPHTFPYHCAAGFQDAHILSSNAQPGILFRSEADQHPSSVYTDNSVAYSFGLISGLMPNLRDMMMHCVQESMVELGNAPSASQYVITALDERNVILGSATITLAASGSLWNGGLWNGLLWGSGAYVSQIEDIPWKEPVIFQRMKLEFYGEAAPGVAIGTVSLRYQTLGYMNAKVSA